MAPATIVIDQLNTRYLVPDADPATVAWLDRVFARVRHESLESALAGAGLNPDSRWCIERIDRRVVLDPSASDASNADRWAQDLVGAVTDSLRTGRVVMYRSDHHVVADIVTGCLAGSMERRWAWTQTGVVRTSWATTPLGLLTTVADHHPTTLRCVLAAMVRRDPGLADRVGFDAWLALARSAVVPRHREPEVASGEIARLVDLVRADIGALALARRLVAAVERHDRATSVPVSDDGHGEVARLVLALADPSGRAVSAAATSALSVVGLAVGKPAAPVIESRPRTTRAGEDRSLPSGTGPSDLDPGDDASPGRTDPDTNLVEGSDPDRSHHEAPPRSDVTAFDRPLDEPAESPGPTAARSVPPLEQVTAVTDHGGLMFLWHLVDALGLPDRVGQAGHQLAPRPLRWVLHQLGLVLTTIDASPPPAYDDAGVLAFAGLAPDDEPPTGEPPSAEEAVALGALSAEITAALNDRMGAEGPTVAELCHRRAEVVADPGWIEIHFDLDQVDLRVRRAGLDLDPGFVPWAGVVLRFVYE